MFSANTLAAIREWALKNYTLFRPNGYGRQYGILAEFDDAPDEVWVIKRNIVDEYDLHNAIQEPIFKDFCGFITDGGQVHEHKDPNQGGLIHTRFNIMISKPEIGGNPVIDGIEVNVKEGEMWICQAGLYKHYCTEVKGNKPRIILSFGFLI